MLSELDIPVRPQPSLIPAGRGKLHSRLRRLRAVVLLDGTVRRSPFAEGVDRSLLDLPLAREQTLLDLWRDEVADLSERLVERPLPCRIIVGRSTRCPSLRPQDRAAGVTVDQDPSDLRGTGGVLRDVTQDYADDDLLLVGNAAQVLVESLCDLVSDGAERGGDVTVIANADGTPASMMLISKRALQELPPIGFIDLKEQGLPLIAARHDVTVLRRGEPSGLPIRTPSDYLAALRAYHRRRARASALSEPFAERWRFNFGVVEAGALVAPDATIHDAVVLRGATVKSGAVLVRSIACGGADVRKGEQVIDSLLTCGSRIPLEPQS